jgi:hypothetical protein
MYRNRWSDQEGRRSMEVRRPSNHISDGAANWTTVDYVRPDGRHVASLTRHKALSRPH